MGSIFLDIHIHVINVVCIWTSLKYFFFLQSIKDYIYLKEFKSILYDQAEMFLLNPNIFALFVRFNLTLKNT